MPYMRIDIGDGEEVLQCTNCGAHTLTGKKSDIKHHKTCTPGEARKWEKFYEQANAEEDNFTRNNF